MFWIKLIGIFVFSSAASAIIAGFQRSRSRLPSAQPFQAPLVPVGTRIPVLFGTWRVRPITTWFGGSKPVPVSSFETPLLFGFIHFGPTRAVRTAYEYQVTMHSVLCWGKIERVVNMVFGEKRLLSDQEATQTVTDPTGAAFFVIPTLSAGDALFINFQPLPLVLDLEVYRGGRVTEMFFIPNVYGGPTFGGGVKGLITLAIGSRQYGADPVMVAALGAGNVPSYSDLATVTYDALTVGESTTPPPIDYIATRHVPDFAGVNYRLIGRSGHQWPVVDTSHAAMLYEALTHPFYGLNTPAWQIDKASFLAAHTQLVGENLGGSMLAGSSSGPQVSTFQQLREECERTCGGVLRRNPETFRWEFKLIRNEATTTGAFNALPHYTEDHIVSLEWQRADPSEVPNSVTVEFSDAEQLNQPDTVTVNNTANITNTRSVRREKVSYLSVTDRETALRLCARDLKERSTPLGRGKAKATRALWRASVGDVIRLSNGKHELNDILVRVVAVDLGLPDNAEIDVTLAEDVFGHADIVRTADPTPPAFTLRTIVRPQVTALRQTETAGVGSLEITILDPEHRLTDLSTKTKSGTGAVSAWVSQASASPDATDPTFPYNDHVTDDDLNGTYTITVTLSDTGPSGIAYRLQFVGYSTVAAPTSDIQEITGDVAFRQLAPPPNTTQTLVEADPIIWDVTDKPNDTGLITLTGNHSLDVVGETNTFNGLLLVTTSAARLLTLPSNSMIAGGDGSNVLSIPVGHTKYSVTFDGTRFWWNYLGTFAITAKLQASVASASSASGVLKVGVRMSASVASASSASAALTASVRLAASVTSASSATGDLSSFEPGDLAHLGIWHRADKFRYTDAGSTPATADNDPVKQWNDVQGSGRNSTNPAGGGSRPLLRLAALGGQDAMQFTFATSQQFFKLDAAWVAALTEGEVFVVFKQNADPPPGPNNVGQIYSLGQGGSGGLFAPLSDGNIYDNFGSNNNHTVGALAAGALSAGPNLYNAYSKTNDWAAALFASGGTSLTFSTATNTVAFPTSLFWGPYLGTMNNTGFNTDGLIAEFLLYDHKLSSIDRAKTTAYLKARYGIP